MSRVSPRARSLALYGAVAALVALAIALVAVRRSHPEATSRAPAPPSSPLVIGRRQAGGDAAPAAAARAARRFALGYLTLIYGHGRPAQVPAARRALRAQLAHNTGRIPPAQRGRRARIVALRLELSDARTAQATATIDDGRIAPWPLLLTVGQTARGAWQVTGLGD